MMKIRKLDIRGFSHDIVLALVVVVVGIGGAAYAVKSHADTPATGSILSGLTAGTSNSKLCLDMSNTVNKQPKAVNGASIDVLPSGSGAVPCSSWQVKNTQKDTANNLQEFSIAYGDSPFCVGVNAPGGLLSLTKGDLTADRTYEKAHGGVLLHKFVQENPTVQLFNCRKNQGDFNKSFQQWEQTTVNGVNVLVNVSPAPPAAVGYTLPQLCMAASGSGNLVRLASCTGNSCTRSDGHNCPGFVATSAGLQWTLPTKGSGGGKSAGSSPAITSFTASSPVTSGDTSKLTWTTSNTTSCSVSPDGPQNTKATSSSWTTPKLTNSGTAAIPKTYTLSCVGQSNASVSKSVTVSINSQSSSGGSGGTASNITCKYGKDTWSGDAAKVGYSVSELSNTDGNPASFSVKLNANKGNTEVVGYPSDQCLMYSALPLSLTSKFSVTPPSNSTGLDYEYAYDIWLTSASAAKAFSWGGDQELMIWNYVNGQVPLGTVKSTLADGSKVWVADASNPQHTVSVVLPQAKTTSATVNIASIITQLQSLGYVPKTNNGILDVEYGIEAPYGGGQTFTVNSLSVTE